MNKSSITRRNFLQISSAFLAASSVGYQSFSLSENAFANNAYPDPDKIVPTLCELCFWRCGVDAHVLDGKLYKLTGQQNHPLSNGKLCPRGTGGAGLLYDPDRLRHPLIREKINGKSQFRKATWEEATSLIAEKLKLTTEQYGKESAVMFSHGFGASFFKKLFSDFGMTHFCAPSYAQCRGPRAEGYKLTYGHAVGSPEGLDVANSKYLVLIGSHLGENMHNTAVQDFANAIGDGLKLVVVDPRFSVAAGKAERWLPIKPGTDLALLRSWIHIILKEKLYDIEFIDQNAIGLEELTQSVANATPENTYAITGIPTEQIIAVARDLGRYGSSALVHPGRHVTWYGDDTQRSRASAILNALLGNYRMPGGLIKQEKFKMPKSEKKVITKMEKGRKFSSKYPFASKIPSNELIEQTMSGSPYPVKFWFVYGTNLVHTLANKKLFLEAINQLDFMVAVDVLPMEITGYADVILPECTYLERYDDLDVRSYRTPYLALRQPVVRPMYDSKPGHEIAMMLADKLDMGESFEEDIESYLDKRLKSINSSLDELKTKGVLTQVQKNLYRQPGEPLRFKTPSGKIELFSRQLVESGFDGVPRYNEPVKNPPGYFRLLFGRSPHHTFGRTANNRFLRELTPENELWVNKLAGEEMKLKHGEYIFLVNQEGVKSETRIKVRLTHRIRPEVVYMYHGFGHTDNRLRAARGKGANDSDLITHWSIDPIMGATGMHNNFVTFTREA